MEIERIIWIYHAFELFSTTIDSFEMDNIKSWKEYNPHCQVIILRPSNLHLYIDYINLEDETAIGLNVLYNFGGVFTTSSVRCQKSMSMMNFRDGIWLFGLYDNEGGVICLPWFIISIPKNEIIKQWLDYCILKGNKSKTKLKVNDVIHDLAYSDHEFDYLWSEHVKLENGRKCYAESRKKYLDNIDKAKGCALLFIDK